jgi:hypothetical protein
MKAKVTIVWLCLVMQDTVEVEWLKTARDRAPSLDGGSMWLFMLANGLWHEYETGRGN